MQELPHRESCIHSVNVIPPPALHRSTRQRARTTAHKFGSSAIHHPMACQTVPMPAPWRTVLWKEMGSGLGTSALGHSRISELNITLLYISLSVWHAVFRTSGALSPGQAWMGRCQMPYQRHCQPNDHRIATFTAIRNQITYHCLSATRYSGQEDFAVSCRLAPACVKRSISHIRLRSTWQVPGGKLTY